MHIVTLRALVQHQERSSGNGCGEVAMICSRNSKIVLYHEAKNKKGSAHGCKRQAGGWLIVLRVLGGHPRGKRK